MLIYLCRSGRDIRNGRFLSASQDMNGKLSCKRLHVNRRCIGFEGLKLEPRAEAHIHSLLGALIQE
jgi:hypothetical protein